MQDISGFPTFEVEFTKDGQVHDEQQVQALLDHLREQPTSDLLCLTHGWNNDMQEARRLYKRLLASVRARLAAAEDPALSDRSFAVLAVLWPSKRFADEDLIPGGAASIDADPSTDQLAELLDDLKGVFDAPDADDKLQQAKALLDDLDTDADARRRFADLVRAVLPADSGDDEDASQQFLALPADELLDRLATPQLPADDAVPAGPVGGAATLGDPAGTAAGLGDLIGGVRGAARNLLNLTTYYQMKVRAGTVGSRGVNAVLRRLRNTFPDLRLHLVGHSFGGRLVTAAALGPPGVPPVRPDSLVLLQAAFSHYGFAQGYEPGRDGLFRAVVAGGLLSGPLVITHTANDRAVGIAYALASRLARQVASALGDATDRYGGIGRNGAQKTPEAIAAALLPAGQPYRLQPGRVHNLEASAFVADHGAVTGPEIAHAILSAVAAM